MSLGFEDACGLEQRTVTSEHESVCTIPGSDASEFDAYREASRLRYVPPASGGNSNHGSRGKQGLSASQDHHEGGRFGGPRRCAEA